MKYLCFPEEKLLGFNYNSFISFYFITFCLTTKLTQSKLDFQEELNFFFVWQRLQHPAALTCSAA